MSNNSTKIAAMAMTAALLTTAFSPVQGSGQLPILKACLAEAKKSPDPKTAINHCTWEHWELMAEYG